MIEGPIPEGLTFDDVLLLPGKSSVLPHGDGHAHVPLAQNLAEHSDRRGGDGHGDGLAPGHRDRAPGRHRFHSPQHDHRAAGGRSGPGEALGKRHDRGPGDDLRRNFRAPGPRHHEEVQSFGLAGDAGARIWWAS